MSSSTASRRRPHAVTDEISLNSSSENHTVLEITYPDGGLQAWLVVLGSWACTAASFGLVSTLGVFEAYLSTHQLKEYSPAQTGWIFGILIFLLYFCGIQIGPYFDAKGPRALLVAGSICLLLSLFTVGLCTEYWQYILSLSIPLGIGFSLLFTPSAGVLAHWFLRRRGNANGVAATGSSIGGVVFPLMMRELLPKVGWAWATRILGFVIMALCIIGILLCRSRIPPQRTSIAIDLSILKDETGALAVTTAGIFFVEWAYFIPVTYIASYYLAGDNLGDDSVSFSFQLLAILNGASCVGRYIPGFLADRLGRFNTMIAILFLCVLSTALWLIDAYQGRLLIAFAVIFGFASGGHISLIPSCVGQLISTHDYGRAYATAYAVGSLAALTGIPIGGALLHEDRGREGFWRLIVFTGSCYVASLACFAWVRIRIAGWNLKAW